jgi:DNA repair photolyase
MYLDRVPRLISYHDTWMSIDPIQGCPYQCVYCVLRYGDKTGVRPQVIASPEETLRRLTQHRFFRLGITPLAIGNETDMFHTLNCDYLVELLTTFQSAGITNSISLITKTPLKEEVLERIQKLDRLKVLFYLSYSGLENALEPGFRDENFRANFIKVKQFGFPIVHYWRPLLPENTTQEAIIRMLEFVSAFADASIISGLKLHPELSKIINGSGGIRIPEAYLSTYGEWLEANAIEEIFSTAKRLCPDYPIYRHGSCALACVLSRPNHTATIYQEDICLPSRCSSTQRSICAQARSIPSADKIGQLLISLGKSENFDYATDCIRIHEEFSQEEFIFLLHVLNYPIKVRQVNYQNIYRGSIFAGQQTVNNKANRK